MRIKPKDPALISLIGEFMKTYLPYVRHRDKDTIESYRHSINLFLAYLAGSKGLSLMTVQSSDFSCSLDKKVIRERLIEKYSK